MKKNPKKLRLHRETVALLEFRVVAGPYGGTAALAGIETSCTEPCGCPTGCSDEQACMGRAAF